MIKLTLEEQNEIKENMERDRYLKLISIIPNLKRNYQEVVKQIPDEVKLPIELIDRAVDMYNLFLTIDISYYIKGGWYPINQTFDVFRHTLINYYRKTLKYNVGQSFNEQFKMIIFNHPYQIKETIRYNYLKKFHPKDLMRYFKPHIHCMIKIPDDRIETFCRFFKSKIKKKFNSSSVVWEKIEPTISNQLRTMKYGYKFQTHYLTENKLQNKELYNEFIQTKIT